MGYHVVRGLPLRPLRGLREGDAKVGNETEVTEKLMM